MDNLCLDVILGLDFQKQHENVILKLGDKKPSPTDIWLIINIC